MRSWLSLLLVAMVGLALTAPAATAHTEVTSTTPKAGAYAKRTLSKVRVRFSQPIRSGRMEVLRAGEKVSTGTGRRSANDVRAIEARIEDELAGGRYVVRWTMTAVDGHTQRGSWRFKVRAPARADAETATPTATPTPTPTATPTATAEPTVDAARTSDDAGSGPWLPIGAVLVAALIATGAALALRRSRRA